MMDAVTFVLGFMLLIWLLHLWGRSTFAGSWAGVILLLISIWLLSNPAVIHTGEVVAYTYDANGMVTQEIHTYTLSPTPPLWEGVVDTSLAQLFGLMLLPISAYMIFWNALHPRK